MRPLGGGGSNRATSQWDPSSRRREIVELIAQREAPSASRAIWALPFPIHAMAIIAGAILSEPPGDFVTAPEISQMFGELIGLWAGGLLEPDGTAGAASPSSRELGPGRGTLMADALRAANLVPEFRAALSVHLVETSGTLRERQDQTLAPLKVPIDWHDRFDEVPQGPLILIANEFFDALPIRQYVRAPTGWHERLIGLDAKGALAFGLAGEADRSLDLAAPVGAVLEISPEGIALAGGRSRDASRPMAAPRSSSITAMRGMKASAELRSRPCADTASPTRSPIRARPTLRPMSILRRSAMPPQGRSGFARPGAGKA